MAQPTTRAEFKEYCLRKLGKPVIEINVDQDQVEDRIDEAISYYNDYHFDGTEKMYAKKQITQTDKDNGYITVPENVIGVVNVFPLYGTSLGTGMFSAKYQFVLNNIHTFTNYDMINYYMSLQYVAFMEELLSGRQPLRYNRHRNRLHIDTDWDGLEVGTWIIYECYEVLDPETFTDMWKDRWLQNYATVLIQEQWGRNLTKFTGMTLPGNVQFNGEQILQQAMDERRRLEEEMIVSYSLPVSDMIG